MFNRKFIDHVKDLKLEEGEIMVSFDVTALFPSVLVDFREYIHFWHCRIRKI